MCKGENLLKGGGVLGNSYSNLLKRVSESKSSIFMTHFKTAIKAIMFYNLAEKDKLAELMTR